MQALRHQRETSHKPARLCQFDVHFVSFFPKMPLGESCCYASCLLNFKPDLIKTDNSLPLGEILLETSLNSAAAFENVNGSSGISSQGASNFRIEYDACTSSDACLPLILILEL